MSGRGKRCSDFRGMMSIIVDNSYTVPFSFVLETALSTVKCRKPWNCIAKSDTQFQRGGKGSEGVGYVMNAGDIQSDRSNGFFSVIENKRSTASVIISNALCPGRIIFFSGESIGYDFSADAFRNLFGSGDLSVQYQEPVFR